MMTTDNDIAGVDPPTHSGATADAWPAKGDLLQLGVECMRSTLAALSTESTLNDVLKLVVAQAMRWLGPDAVILGKLDPATQTLVIQAAEGPQTGADRAVLLALGLPALGDALVARRPVLCSERRPASAGAPNLAVLAIPLLDADDLPFGGVFLYYATPPQLSAVELDLADMLGSQVALAIKHGQQKAKAQTSAIQRERNRIARDLHDSVTQALYTISLIAETLPTVWQSHHAEALQSTETLRLLAQSALMEMRTLLLELRPDEQADRNLDERLRQLPGRLFIRSQVQITTTAVGNALLAEDVQAALYRIAQEALNNVDKHANATRAAVQLHCRSDGTVMLRINDNGCGFDPGKASPNQLGLSIIRERAQEIGAMFNIASQPGQGTQITVEWDGRQGEQAYGAA